ncbi:MAG: phenylacetic acid degradation-related protein [Bacteroidota bacterium]|nr:phenylacetic acid degradation-related protein [Bacteroidota bacterium]
MNARIEFFKNQIGKDKWAFDYPLMEWLKAQVLEADESHVKMQFTVEAYMLNPIGMLHGGVVATMLDELMGAAGFLLGRLTGYATINMNVDYLYPARLGEKITGEGRIIRAGKTVLHAESKLHNAGNRLLAKATSNLIATTTVLPI